MTARDQSEINNKLQEASTHKSAKTHAGNVFVTRDLDLFDSQHKRFSSWWNISVSSLVIIAASIFFETDAQTNGGKSRTPQLSSA